LLLGFLVDIDGRRLVLLMKMDTYKPLAAALLLQRLVWQSTNPKILRQGIFN
jgi:hypothetical protein